MIEEPTFDELMKEPGHNALVLSEADKLATLWRASDPELDTEVGVVRDLVVYPGAEASALSREYVDQTRLRMSLREMARLGVPADDPRIDTIMENFPAYVRRDANIARTSLAIVRDDNTIFTIPARSRMAYDGLVFYTESSYTGTPYRVNTANDRLMQQRPDGKWSFTFPVVAEAPGEQYNILAGTVFVWEATNTVYDTIYAVADASGGKDAETTAELLSRMDEYIAVPGVGGRMNIASLVRREFSYVLDVSLIGAGDPEMQRDGVNAFSIKTGGRCDMYVRTAERTASLKFELEGELTDPSTHLVRIKVNRDVYPGFYAVRTVRRASASLSEAVLIVQGVSFGMDLADSGYELPLVPSAQHARFSRYQTAEIWVKDPNFDPEDTQYTVELTGMPGIGDIQDFLSRRDIRAPNGDILVKAAVPYHVVVNATVRHRPGTANLSKSDIKKAIMAAVGARRFEDGGLSSLHLGAIINRVLPAGAEAAPPIEMYGAVDLPNGTVSSYRSTLELEAPTNYALGVSPRTVAFIPRDAAVAFEQTAGVRV